MSPPAPNQLAPRGRVALAIVPVRWSSTSMARVPSLLLTALLVLGASVVGCTRRNVNMTPTGQAAATLKPHPGNSLVVFLRPGRAAGLVHASVYDDDTILGVSSANTAIPYQAKPGTHRFMVVGEAADFLDADLVEGRTYYVLVGYRTGAWRVRFSLVPLDPQRQAK
jgi:hypothetical protein